VRNVNNVNEQIIIGVVQREYQNHCNCSPSRRVFPSHTSRIENIRTL